MTKNKQHTIPFVYIPHKGCKQHILGGLLRIYVSYVAIKMTKQIITILVILTSLFNQSCSYKMIRTEDVEGNKFGVHYYKDYEKRKQYLDRNVFKYQYNREHYDKYSGNIICDTINGSTFIEFDSVRVYLFNGTEKYKDIFTTGLLSGQMLYCKLDTTCKPIKGLELKNAETGEKIVENLWGWTGHTITIDHFEELSYLKEKPTVRRFKFWVYPYKIRFNGANNIFILELTNPDVNKMTDLKEFIEKAEVTFLLNARTMI